MKQLFARKNCIYVKGNNGKPVLVGEISNIETANFIVRAVNSHAELIGALKAVKKYDARLQSHGFKGKNYVEDDDLDSLYEDFITKTNKALAKATKED